MSTPHRASFLLLLFTLGCSEREPPALPAQARQVISATQSSNQPTQAGLAPQTTAPAPGTPADASVNAMPTASAPTDGQESPKAAAPSPSSLPELYDERGQALPQTEELPTLTSLSLLARTQKLLNAIVLDQPESADEAFFPLVAYAQVKAIAAPERDHKLRLLAAYHRNIHEYHRKLAKLEKPITLVALEPSTQKPQWMKPGSEGNKLGYYRMLRSGLRLRDAAGTEHRLSITSMISWRGEWYVVHLDGFK